MDETSSASDSIVYRLWYSLGCLLWSLWLFSRKGLYGKVDKIWRPQLRRIWLVSLQCSFISRYVYLLDGDYTWTCLLARCGAVSHKYAMAVFGVRRTTEQFVITVKSYAGGLLPPWLRVWDVSYGSNGILMLSECVFRSGLALSLLTGWLLGNCWRWSYWTMKSAVFTSSKIWANVFPRLLSFDVHIAISRQLLCKLMLDTKSLLVLRRRVTISSASFACCGTCASSGDCSSMDT